MKVMDRRVHTAVERTFRSDWGRIVATLIRQFGDFELAEDVAQEAFAAAIAQWPREGVPDLAPRLDRDGRQAPRDRLDPAS